MLTGYNTDFKYQGKVYHCQTEDGGVNSPFIISLLYQQGAILASRKTSYADILKADCLDDVVRELMMEQHKQMIRDLMQGKLDLQNAPHEATYQPKPDAAQKPAEAAPVAPPPPVKEQPKPAEPKQEAPGKVEPKREEPKKEEPKKEEPRKEEPKQAETEDIKEKSLDDIILEFLAQEEKERKQRK